jgi:hypothetical protein
MLTGCNREPRPRSLALRITKKYLGVAEELTDVLQLIYPRVQRSTPSCVGQAAGACVQGILCIDASGIQIWKGARRRDGNLYDASVGTWVTSAIAEMTQRGIADRIPGEETDEAHFTDAPDLKDELQAHDRRLPKLLDHHVTDGPWEVQRDQIVHALHDERGVIWTTGVTERLMDHPANVLVDPSEVGVDYNGHAMRIAGYVRGGDLFIVQNWWGTDWAGVVALGRQLPGCCLVPAQALIEQAWDTWILQLQP